jgi:DNA-3-methyladenine glycosylase
MPKFITLRATVLIFFTMEKLPLSFYDRKNVVLIARELLGKVLVTHFDGVLTIGRITETEAYNGVVDRASHAYGGRRTKRTEIMFGHPGYAYVYLCYGIHHLFNVVTNARDTPHAVLIRGIEPLEGIPAMLTRMNRVNADRTLGKGPGNVSRALGIQVRHTGYSLLSEELFIASDGYKVKKSSIQVSSRIGVDYAGEDALLPYRFNLTGVK